MDFLMDLSWDFNRLKMIKVIIDEALDVSSIKTERSCLVASGKRSWGKSTISGSCMNGVLISKIIPASQSHVIQALLADFEKVSFLPQLQATEIEHGPQKKVSYCFSL